MAQENVAQRYSAPQMAAMSAIRRIAVPLARLAVALHIPYRAVADLIKSAMIEVASQEHPLVGQTKKRQTKSRVAMLTGVTRSEVDHYLLSQQRELPTHTRPLKPMVIVEAWIEDSDFHDDQGNPAVLSIRGPGNTFEELVRRYGADMPPITVLDELVRAGTASKVDKEHVKLEKPRYVPNVGDPQSLQILGMTGSQFLGTGVQNVLVKEEQDRLFQRRAYTDCLPPEKAAELRDRLSALLSEYIQDAKEEVRKAEDYPPVQGYHMTAGVGIYYFEE